MLAFRRRPVLTQSTNLDDVVGHGLVHCIDFPCADDDVRRLRSEVFAKALAGERLMVVSATANEFSWELINRVIVTEPRLDSEPVNINDLADGAAIADGAMILEPSLLKTPTAVPTAGPLAAAAVILARTGLSVVADMGEAADLLRRRGIAVVGAVVVTSASHRWRKWRRFADAFGVGRNPERPWPVIDVLEEEIARTRRDRKSQ